MREYEREALALLQRMSDKLTMLEKRAGIAHPPAPEQRPRHLRVVPTRGKKLGA
jgi:hypothetical protein